MTDDYDYDKYSECIQNLLGAMWRNEDDLEIGEDISDVPEVKIIFDGHGDLEVNDEDGNYLETIERGNKNMESYAVFIHKDAKQDDFTFPEHETAWHWLVHRPKEEVCIYAWYDVENDEWSINSLDETSDHTMTNKEVMDILEHLNKKYFEGSE